VGATEFLDLDYQKAMIPFVVAYLDQSNSDCQGAACTLLGSMPEAAAPALPALQRLSTSDDISISQTASAAIDRIKSVKGKSEQP
jgi:hypothetical protein